MPYDPSGNFTRDYDWTTDRNNGVKVRADRMDGEFNNVATALNQVILRNGAAAFTGNIQMGGNSIVSLADGTVGTPAIRFLGSPTSGIYSPGLDRVSLTASGTNRVEANATGVLTTGVFGHTGAAGITGTFGVSGAVSFASTLGVTGAVTGGSLNTAGAVNSGTLVVSGGSTLGSLGVTGAATVGTTLGVTGATTLNSTLNVAGLTTVNALTVNSAANYAGGINIGGVLNFSTSPGIIQAGGVNVLRMTNAEAVSIGTSLGLPGAELDVQRASTFGGKIRLRNTAVDVGLEVNSNVAGYVGTYSAHPFIVLTGGAGRLTIDPAGAATFGSTLGVAGKTTTAGLYSSSSMHVPPGNAVGLSGNSDLRTFIYSPSGTDFAVRVNSVDRLSINGGGDAAFSGVLSVASTLTVSGSATVAGGIGAGGAPVDANIPVNSYARTGSNYGGRFADSTGANFFDLRPNVGGVNGLYTNGSLPLALSARGTATDLVLATNGDANFGASLGVAVDMYVGNGSQATATHFTRAAGTAVHLGVITGLEVSRLQTTAAATTLRTSTASPISLGTNGTDRLSITATGETYFQTSQAPTNVRALGYLGVPQVGGASKGSNYTAVLADAGQHILMSGVGLTATIPANASVAYPVGTTLTFVNDNASSLSISINTDTMTFAGTTTTGTRTLAQNGVATAIKTGTNAWIISGPGLA